MTEEHPLSERRMPATLIYLTLVTAAASCSADRNVVAIVDQTGGGGFGAAGSSGTSSTSGRAASTGSAGNTTSNSASTTGGSVGRQASSGSGGGNSGASADWITAGGALVQDPDFAAAGSLGTLVFADDPAAVGTSSNGCFCVPPDPPSLCSIDNRTDYPICGEGCAGAAPDCIGSCPCGEPLSDSITLEGIECLKHEQCGPQSACLIVEDADTHQLIASHCL